jgi:transposase InsO family protein
MPLVVMAFRQSSTPTGKSIYILWLYQRAERSKGSHQHEWPGRWRDNIYVERMWRSLKYEDIYLKSYEGFRQLKIGLSRYFWFYNSKRFHQSLEYQTPDEMYESFQVPAQKAVAWRESTLNQAENCCNRQFKPARLTSAPVSRL